MFTIKWIYKIRGGTAERIFSASEAGAAFNDGDKPVAARWASRDVHRSLFVVGFPHDLESSISLNCGKVYVMNEAGKTVASYDLGDEPPPDDKESPISGLTQQGNQSPV